MGMAAVAPMSVSSCIDMRFSLQILPTIALGAVLGSSFVTVPARAEVSSAERLAILVKTYPAVIDKIDGNSLVLRSGRRLLIDDGRKKSHAQKLKNADIEDMLSQVYPLGICDASFEGPPSPRNVDPGRIRNDQFFREMYGRTKAEARKNLTSLKWFGKKLLFTKVNGANKALAAVRDELTKLPRRFHKFFEKSGGTFNWRNIARTKRLSVHSFGAAIDINTKYTNYWIWSGGKPGNVPKYRNKIPSEIVEIFERHGFIWGGKWYHYDTMHFEYRPALIAIGHLFAKRGCNLHDKRQ